MGRFVPWQYLCITRAGTLLSIDPQASEERVNGCVKVSNRLATAVELQAKLDACQPRSVAGFSFYNQGLMRYNALDWIKAALAVLDDLTGLEE